MAAFAAGAANANDELNKMSQNPKDWAMPTENYANHRYSQLKQITADNVGKLQVRGRSRPACCAATRVDRS
jgi:lanthanide-dependent methanol dehydrogenase